MLLLIVTSVAFILLISLIVVSRYANQLREANLGHVITKNELITHIKDQDVVHHATVTALGKIYSNEAKTLRAEAEKAHAHVAELSAQITELAKTSLPAYVPTMVHEPETAPVVELRAKRTRGAGA